MPNAWVEHVRKFASKNNMSYGCAVSDAECKASYHRQKARNAKKTRTPAQEMEGMGAEDMPVAEAAKRRRARVSKARQAQVAEADPPKKQKDFTYKTREEKLEYARLQDLAEKAAAKDVAAPKPKKRVTAAKKVIDNFDLLKKISGFVQEPKDGIEAYRGYSPSYIRTMMKKIFRGDIPGRAQAERSLEIELNAKRSSSKMKLGEMYEQEYLSKTEEEKEKMLSDELADVVYSNINKLKEIEEWKQEQEKLLTEVKTVNVEHNDFDNLFKIKARYNAVGLRVTYQKINGKWYYIGLKGRWDQDVRLFDAYYYVPNYTFVEDGKNITKSVRGSRKEEEGVTRAWDRLEEMGMEKDQPKKKKSTKD
jgi:hypothetical protein